jgi:hypothetical protein
VKLEEMHDFEEAQRRDPRFAEDRGADGGDVAPD